MASVVRGVSLVSALFHGSRDDGALNLFLESSSTAPELPSSPPAASYSMNASYPLAVYPDNSYLVGSGRGRLVSCAIVFLFSRENARFF